MLRRKREFGVISAVLLFVLISPAVGWAKGMGVVTGRVIDQIGAVIPNARVTVHNEGTGASTTVTTDDSGFYRVEAEVGQYSITLSHPGFVTFTRTGVRIVAGTTTVADLRVPYGAPEQAVTLTEKEISESGKEVSQRDRLGFLVGVWDVEGKYYAPWVDAPPVEEIKGEVSIDWDLNGLVLTQLWHVFGDQEETGERHIRILLYWDAPKDIHRLFWFDSRSNVHNLEGNWEEDALVLEVPDSIDNKKVYLHITPRRLSENSHTLTVEVVFEENKVPRFEATLSRK